eukprot:gnl/Chilomastix_caulleri/8198.p2 GENE.gnl/Chilomastix_caulleri/8198~~gnl/Chilomastix_caulleri/8198.p2  ORF type:complete len:53 (+),score=9.41 gnl/Chilomastix_caulleri/8198:61-219(+)
MLAEVPLLVLCNKVDAIGDEEEHINPPTDGNTDETEKPKKIGITKEECGHCD